MKNKIKDLSLIVLFLGFIFCVAVLNFIQKDELISISERRYLKQFPNINTIFNGTYSNDFENYAMDQMIKRDDFRKVKEFVHFNVLRQNDNNGLLVNEFGIFKQTGALNKFEVEKIVKKYKTIKEKYFAKAENVFFSIVPDKNYYLTNNDLRLDYETLEKTMVDKLNNEMEYIKIFDLLNINNYYQTDSHWKQEELKPVADKLLNKLGTNKELTIDEVCIKGDFLGVYGSQLALSNNYKDSLKYIVNDTINKAYTYNYETEKYTAIYDEEKWLKSNDKYDYFVSGATPVIDIINPLNEDAKELIIFRDSYGSSIAPLLLEGYSKITLVDLRYIHPNYISYFVKFDNIENKDILFLNSTLIINEASILK